MGGATGQMPRLSFGLPPSLGRVGAWELARDLATVLHGAGFSTVVPFRTYAEIEQHLFTGEIDVAWAPPVVCARVEAAGGHVALRGVRAGATSYRSVLVARAQDAFDLDVLDRGAFRPRAAWVDKASLAGYVLPRAYLRSLGLSLDTAFLQQVLLGSYSACVDALLGFETDLTALFVRAEGLEPIWGPKAARMKELAFTDEVPNDGVVISPNLAPERAAIAAQQLVRLLASPARSVIAAMFQVDTFDEPPPGTYAPVLKLV